MYYVSREQIDERLATIPWMVEAAGKLTAVWSAEGPDLLHGLAQERLLHLAGEVVTDAGSLLIDGFLMRDASSYEDIVDILYGEGVLADELHAPLVELVRLRKPLVQQYARWPRDKLHPLTASLTALLPAFAEAVRAFIMRETANL